MKYKVIGIDLDGTLLTKFKRIKKQNLEAIRKYVQHGGIPILVTGRSTVSGIRYLNKIEKYCDTKLRFISCFNGAHIFDRLNDKEYKNFIENKTAKELYEYAKANKLIASFYTEKSRLNNSVEYYGFSSKLWNKLFKNLNVTKFNPNEDASSYKINLISPSTSKIKKAYDTLTAKYKNVLEFSYSSKHLIEINNYGINKGYAMNFFINLLKITKDETMFIGDSFNDVPGFNACGYSFAIKPHNPEVNKYAKDHIDSKKNALVKILEDFVIKNDPLSDVRMIVTDLDGTLLDTKSKLVLPVTCERLRAAVDDRNLYFAIATGRNIDDVKMILKSTGIKTTDNCYGILNNGSLIYEFKTNQYLFIKVLNSSDVDNALNEIKKLNESRKFGELGCYVHRIIDLKNLENNEPTQLYGYNLKFVRKGLVRMSKNFTTHNWYPKDFNEVDPAKALVAVCKFVIYTDSPKNNMKVFDYFKNLNMNVEITTSSPTNVEINAKGVSKGNAVSFLVEKLGLNVNQAMTLGDEENDSSMLSITSKSYTLKTSKISVQQAASNVLDSRPSVFVTEAIDKEVFSK